MRFLAIDGNSILNRAFYGIKLLTNKKGQFTNAIFGFTNIYLRHGRGRIRPALAYLPAQGSRDLQG